jgi:hypothetical protein
MGKIASIVQKLSQAKPEQVESRVLAIVKENESAVLDLNIEQLSRGVNAQNRKITPPYTKRTKQIKAYKGQPTDRVTLRDEGDFQQGFFLEVDKFPIVFRSSDYKEPKLMEKYGDDIFGLTQKNKTVVAQEFVKEGLQKWLKEIISV